MFGILHMDGSGEDDPPVHMLGDLYDELYHSGVQDGDVAVINDDSGWCISAYRSGTIVLEQLGTRGRTARHMNSVTKERVLDLWRHLISGEIEALLNEPWLPGYGS